MNAIVSEKGQVTVPKKCRERLGLHPGIVIDFEAVDGVLIGRKVEPRDVFNKWRGRGQLLGATNVDDYLERVRS